MSDCLLDVVIAVDLSRSTLPPRADLLDGTPTDQDTWYGGTVYEGERQLLESIVSSLNPGMLDDKIQIGLVFFC